MRIAVGADHGGYRLKGDLIRQLKSAGHRVLDAGTFSPEPCDYPAIGARVAKAVSRGTAKRGILLCKSGAGMGIVANKFPRVRAVVVLDVQTAKHSREHNDANILVLGANHVVPEKAKKILAAWLETPFGAGRHARRLRQIQQIEKGIFPLTSFRGRQPEKSRRK